MTENPISDTLKMIPYGIYVVTSRDGDDRNAMVLNWLTQSSFETQHLVIGLQRTSYSYGLIEKSRKFVVNVLRKEDAETLKAFTKSRGKYPEKFNDANYTDAPVTGAPVLVEAAGYLECEVVSLFDTGSGHDVVIAKIVGAGVQKEGKAGDTLTLVELGWNYAG